MVHEADRPVVPVVVAGEGVDGVLVVLVGCVELRVVVLGVPGGVDDVAADDHEVRVPPAREERVDHGVLRSVPLPRVSNHYEGDRLPARALVDDQVFWQPPRLALQLHSEAAFVVSRVSEEPYQVLVARPPEGDRVDP